MSTNSTYVATYFNKERNDTIAKRLLEEFVEQNLGNDITYEKLCSDQKFAYMTFAPHLMIGNVKCRLLRIRDPVTYSFLSMILGTLFEASPYAKIINHQ